MMWGLALTYDCFMLVAYNSCFGNVVIICLILAAFLTL